MRGSGDGGRNRRRHRAGEPQARLVRREPPGGLGGGTRLRRHDPNLRRARRPPRDPRGRSRAGRRGGRDDHRGPGHRRRASDLRRRHGGRRRRTCPTTPSEMPRWPRSGGRRAGPSPWTFRAGRHRCSWRCSPDSLGWSSSAPRTSPWRSCRSPAGSAITASWPTAESGSSPRSAFPEADELIQAWPEEAFERIGLDDTCYVCVLSHDPKFDEPALRLALRSPAAYIGAHRVQEDPGRAPRAPRRRGIHTGRDRPDPRTDRARPRRASAGRDGAGDSGGDDGVRYGRGGRGG